eukprot:2190856-Alexandrium_andersonii.AAC.1
MARAVLPVHVGALLRPQAPADCQQCLVTGLDRAHQATTPNRNPHGGRLAAIFSPSCHVSSTSSGDFSQAKPVRSGVGQAIRQCAHL